MGSTAEDRLTCASFIAHDALTLAGNSKTVGGVLCGSNDHKSVNGESRY